MSELRLATVCENCGHVAKCANCHTDLHLPQSKASSNGSGNGRKRTNRKAKKKTASKKRASSLSKEKRDERIVASYKEGESMNSIAKQYGLSAARVRGILIEKGAHQPQKRQSKNSEKPSEEKEMAEASA